MSRHFTLVPLALLRCRRSAAENRKVEIDLIQTNRRLRYVRATTGPKIEHSIDKKRTIVLFYGFRVRSEQIINFRRGS
jgi:hypothetical protein